MEQKLIELRGKTDKPTIIVRDFNTFSKKLIEQVDRKSASTYKT